MTDSFRHSASSMGTVVTIEVVGHGANERERSDREAAVARALAWFDDVESSCSRFDTASETYRLSQRIGEAVPVSAMVFETLRFALAVAEETDGAFDPTVGLTLERRGFNIEHRSGRVVESLAPAEQATFRDVILDEIQKTVMLAVPLVLDLGAVAKGLAIDMAAHELMAYEDFAINAGGDLYLSGHNAVEQPWSVGIRHPRDAGALLETLRVSGTAVCTSGDYERTSPTDGEHHIVDPRAGKTARSAASVTVLAPSAMVADALATAAFVLGPTRGIALLERHGVEGIIVTPDLERFTTHGMRSDYTMATHAAEHHR